MSKIIAISILILFAIIASGFTINSLMNAGDEKINSSDSLDTHLKNFTGTQTIYETNSSSIPSNNFILSSINWSKYPHTGNHYISNLSYQGPNTVINHPFLKVTIEVEIKNPDDVLEVFKELSSIVKEERAMLGPNSAPELWGKANGFDAYHVGMLPYSTEIYRIDYYHPVNNLTWSDIDASEIE